uniref:Uncharacterized protein n=1 Tax=Arundo donax TaxID=35708 RepID=A0A0A9DTK3_ARUDO
MMVSSPNLAFRHGEPRGTTPPGPERPRNCHDRVVCSFRPLFGKTDTTPGCLAISAASAASRLAAKPLMCFVYE